MMAGGYTGKIGFVDLSNGEIREEKLDEGMARSFIGGCGLGVRVLYERQKKGVDPLGPENILGFTTGPLTGTRTPTGGRYMAVCKSPLTGGWGDANSGGYFGSELKSAGWDAIFVSGIASKPTYLLITDKGIELKKASHLWGLDTHQTEAKLAQETGNSRIRTASIGPASEKLSLISGIINDSGRAAARSGVGAVMGSKRLKAVVVSGTGKVAVADAGRLDELRKDFIQKMREAGGFVEVLMKHGTCGLTGALITGGATPVKNWLLAGAQALPEMKKITDPDTLIAPQVRKYACANCPVACGGIYKVAEGRYPVEDAHKPEYETVGAFGAMCLNTDLGSIIKLNDMCNRGGLDTISAGSVIAFTMECYEKGIISKSDADGLDLLWGNSDAMITLLDKIIRREGFGDILADGVKIAARKIGKGADACAIHVGGQEPGLHNALFLPGRGTGYACDPTPGRHTAAPMARLDAGASVVAPYPELTFPHFEKYEYRRKGPASAVTSKYSQIGNSAGVCLFPTVFFGFFPLVDFLNAVTGWDMDMAEALQAGGRIQTLRKCFNVREGIAADDSRLPQRMAGIPPKAEGPLKGVTIDMEGLAEEFHKAMGWEAKTGTPTEATTESLGLKGLVKQFG
ncbi:MAG: aldehyde ferredoxin oxidoreductase family protein [Desulfobacterales bacterium]|nr:aldehyde ferredoxin oxidoreductase family protein [Desulfobacterales bacterium]